MLNVRHTLATSPHPVARFARRVRAARRFSLPLPRFVMAAMLGTFVALRSIYYWCVRVFIAEPIFKAYCREYGKNVHTDVFIHWVQGKGDLVLGDDVLVDGKCAITFAARYTSSPTLRIGDGSGIGHGCMFTIGKSITIGRNCRIAAGVWMFDSSGHASAPDARLRNESPAESDVKPIVVGDNVWIGGRSIVFPGVTIGEGSIVAAGSVVTTDVPPYSLVAGNPSRRVGSLERPGGVS